MRTDMQITVWDPLLRLFHWSLAAFFLTAYVTDGEWQAVHTWSGYGVLALLLFRVVWGVTGPPHARFSDFVRGPKTVLSHLKDVLTFRARRYVGHNPAGGAMIVALLLSLLATGLSGLALYGADQGMGPLAVFLIEANDVWIDVIEEAHEVLANFTVALVLIHVTGVVWESVLLRENLIAAMLNGRKRV